MIRFVIDIKLPGDSINLMSWEFESLGKARSELANIQNMASALVSGGHRDGIRYMSDNNRAARKHIDSMHLEWTQEDSFGEKWALKVNGSPKLWLVVREVL